MRVKLQGDPDGLFEGPATLKAETMRPHAHGLDFGPSLVNTNVTAHLSTKRNRQVHSLGQHISHILTDLIVSLQDTNKHDINPQNAKESLQLARGYLTRPYLDWTGDMCGDFKNQAVYVGFLSAQTERILDSSSRDGAGVCCVGMFLSTQLHEQANTQAFSKWLDLMTLLHSDGHDKWYMTLLSNAANNIFKAFQTDCDKAERLATARVNQGCSPKQLCREQEAELLKANPDMSGFIGLYIDRFHAHGATKHFSRTISSLSPAILWISMLRRRSASLQHGDRWTLMTYVRCTDTPHVSSPS
ncbi:TPA: hypothetical protein ACH3X1_009185 [Trebouxia sp. C0004]